jgi:hypothetical protein
VYVYGDGASPRLDEHVGVLELGFNRDGHESPVASFSLTRFHVSGQSRTIKV